MLATDDVIQMHSEGFDISAYRIFSSKHFIQLATARFHGTGFCLWWAYTQKSLYQAEP